MSKNLADKIQKYIGRYREHKEKRHVRSFNNFMNKINRAEQLLKQIEEKILNTDCIQEAYLQYIISSITAFEVYFKDIFAAIFILCNDDIIYPRCRGLVDIKYSMDDIIDLRKYDIYELMLRSLNFQNLSEIERVFSKVLDQKGIFSELERRKTFKTGAIAFELQENFYNGLKQYINLRHEFVHDFNPELLIEKKNINQYQDNMILFIVAFDIFVHKEFIEKHLKTDFK